jgi:hypothetical protein
LWKRYKDVKVIILAGGWGSRLGKQTEEIPNINRENISLPNDNDELLIQNVLESDVSNKIEKKSDNNKINEKNDDQATVDNVETDNNFVTNKNIDTLDNLNRQKHFGYTIFDNKVRIIGYVKI